MATVRIQVAAGALLVGGLLFASPAAAWRASLTEDLSLDLEIHVAGGYAVVVLPPGEAEGGGGPDGDAEAAPEVGGSPYMRMARIRSRLTLDGIGWAKVQVEARSGHPELLDAVVALTPIDELTIRVGQFKTPVSADFLVPLPNHPLTTRPLLVRHVPRRRVGIDVTARIPIGRMRLDLEVGLFGQEDAPFEGQGKLFTGRIGLRVAEGLRFHLAYAEHLLQDSDMNPGVGLPPAREGGVVDAAIIFENERVTLHAESVVVLQREEGHLPWGLTGMVGYSFGDRQGSFAIQPVFAYDLWRDADSIEHRFTTALNFYFAQSHAIIRLNYEAALRDGAVGHAVMIEAQISF